MPRKRNTMAHKYYNDSIRRDGGRDLNLRDRGRDLRDGGGDLRDGGGDLRDGGRDSNPSRDGGGRDKGYMVQDFPPPSKNLCFII